MSNLYDTDILTCSERQAAPARRVMAPQGGPRPIGDPPPDEDEDDEGARCAPTS